MSRSWSQQVEARYHLRLPADVCAWLDNEIWRIPGGAEFCQPQSPEQLMDPEPGVVWAGFMLPDTLPIVSNGYGDWLCLRIGPDSSVPEILHWSHGGGDWLPYGKCLAESLLYDAAALRLFPRQPEFVAAGPTGATTYRYAEWARNWLTQADRPLDPFWEADGQSEKDHRQLLYTNLARMHVAEIPLGRDRVESFLASPFRRHSETRLATRLGVPWEPDFVYWLFDHAVVPTIQRSQLAETFHVSDDQFFRQNWDAAAQEALSIIRQRSDIGWSFDIAGWHAERAGQREQAAQYYLQGARASLFSDDTVRFRTHWYEQGFGKFSIARLAHLIDVLSDQQRRDPYLQIFWQNDAETLKYRVCDHWMAKARAAERDGDHRGAYGCYYQAGWDVGLPSIGDYEDIFKGLIRNATAAGSRGLSTIAQLHLKCLYPGQHR